MDSTPNRSFGEHWEEGIEIEHKVNTYLYWRKKMQREISRSLTLRDRKSLADLIKYSVLLREIHRETNISSSSVSKLFAGIALINPYENSYKGIMIEYLTKLPKLPKNQSCRIILGTACEKYDYKALFREQLSDITSRSATNNFSIEDISELRIALSLFHEVDEHFPQKMKIFRTDPTIEFPIHLLLPYFEASDCVHLVNRVDKLPADLESWKCLNTFLTDPAYSEKVTENVKEEIHNYVSGYWVHYHLPIAVDNEVQIHRNSVFKSLMLNIDD